VELGEDVEVVLSDEGGDVSLELPVVPGELCIVVLGTADEGSEGVILVDSECVGEISDEDVDVSVGNPLEADEELEDGGPEVEGPSVVLVLDVPLDPGVEDGGLEVGEPLVGSVVLSG